MSVGEDNTECPLCMEPLELDDINFFPCTCGYQICRFCWHRIRTDENGLCPACRKAYPEDPAEFKPLTEDELQRIKKERRQKEAQRKQKAAENRKHLANVRVVQKNLVFVVGLSQRLADPEVLRKHEYFGKFGKIHKVVINQSTSYAGAQVGQGPSASAYVTYHKPEDALRAIQAVNNIHVDGRTIKASLGTTKYCSHFLRGLQCPKPDCMYLHELGEEAASFTKEEMQQGKHQEYEQKLYEMFMNSQNLAATSNGTTPAPTSTASNTKGPSSRKKGSSPPQASSPPLGHTPPPHSTPEAWPSLGPQQEGGSEGGSPTATTPLPLASLPLPPASFSKPDRLTNGNKAHPPAPHHGGSHSQPSALQPEPQHPTHNRAPGFHRNGQHIEDSKGKPGSPEVALGGEEPQYSGLGGRGGLPTSPHHHHGGPRHPAAPGPPHSAPLQAQPTPFSGVAPPPGLAPVSLATRKLPFQTPTDSMSLFSSTNGFPASRNPPAPPSHSPDETLPAAPEITDTIAVSSSTDWQAAFGFTSTPADCHDDDLGFDPWNESAKGLAEIIEKENSNAMHHTQHSFRSNHIHQPVSPSSPRQHGGLPHPAAASAVPPLMASLSQKPLPKTLPPGFPPNHIGALANNQMGFQGSKIMGLMHIPTVPPSMSGAGAYHDLLNDGGLLGRRGDREPHRTMDAGGNTKDWQDGLRALLPNINISFGAHSQSEGDSERRSQQPSQPHSTSSHKNWSPAQNPPELCSWDPAIVTSGHITDASTLEETPHWMASLHSLTEDSGSSAAASSAAHHTVPLMQQLAFCSAAPPAWPSQALPLPPPGFHQPQLRPQVTPELHNMAEGYQ